MNQGKKITAILLATVIFCSVLTIGGIWGIYIAEQAVSSTTDSSASSSQSESQSSTTKAPPTHENPKKMIALTFDDGPSGVYTHQILDLLEQYQAKATFFVCGYQLYESNKDELQRAISLGCAIGNHSENHKSFPTLAENEEELINEIRATNEKIARLSGTDYQCTIYRPPYGNINREVVEIFLKNGIRMHSVHWNSDSRDWEYRKNYDDGKLTREEAIEGAFNTVVSEVSEGSVVLMHDIQSITPDLVKRILKKYTAEGYTFVTVQELFGFQEMQDEESYYNRYYSANRISPMS